jgi:hypothetical protein
MAARHLGLGVQPRRRAAAPCGTGRTGLLHRCRLPEARLNHQGGRPLPSTTFDELDTSGNITPIVVPDKRTTPAHLESTITARTDHPFEGGATATLPGRALRHNGGSARAQSRPEWPRELANFTSDVPIHRAERA